MRVRAPLTCAHVCITCLYTCEKNKNRIYTSKCIYHAQGMTERRGIGRKEKKGGDKEVAKAVERTGKGEQRKDKEARTQEDSARQK